MVLDKNEKPITIKLLPLLKLIPTGAGLVCTEFPCPGFIDLHAELGAPLDHALTE